MRLLNVRGAHGNKSMEDGAIPKWNCPFSFLQKSEHDRGMWDGIGGEMIGGVQKQAVVWKPHGKGSQKKPVNPGKAKMNAAADKTLEKNSAKIAKALLNSTISGNASSAKLLFDLADGQIDLEEEGTMERLCSLAEKLASEPQWEGETAKSTAEPSIG